MKNIKQLGAAALIAASPALQASTISLIDEDFVGASFSKEDTLERDMTGWVAGNGTHWNYGEGNSWLFNTHSDGDQATESPLTQVVNLGSAGLTNQSTLDVSFSYNAWQQNAGNGGLDDLYVHIWGLVDKGSSPTSTVASLGSTNGNSWGGSDTDFTRYNLKDGAVLPAYNSSTNITAAIKLTGLDTDTSADSDIATYNHSIDLSGYALGEMADYDYLVITFAKNSVVGSGRGLAFQGVQVAAVPEPTSAALLSIGTLGLMLKRRR